MEEKEQGTGQDGAETAVERFINTTSATRYIYSLFARRHHLAAAVIGAYDTVVRDFRNCSRR